MADNDQERVPCEECGQNDAVCTVAVMMGKQVLHRRLCQACMAKTSMSVASGNVAQVLGAIMAAARNAAEAAARQAEQTDAPQEQAEASSVKGAACPHCGRAFGMSEVGLAGCVHCYSAFRSHLEQFYADSCPQVKHVGRRPLNTAEAQRLRAKRESLQRRMEEAAACEDFETAAKLRDALRSMGDGEENG